MSDQACELRRLMVDRSRPDALRRSERPRRIVVAGGKGGVGTTTVAIHLALANAGHRALLIDADPSGGDVAMRCGIDDRYTLRDLLAGRRHPTDIIQVEPSGIQIVPGSRCWDSLGNDPKAAVERLLEAIDSGGTSSDTVVIDAGNSPNRTASRLWQAADAAIMVTNGETTGIVRAYDAIKTLIEHGGTPPMFVLVNMAATPSHAESVYRRIAQTGRRFLGVHLDSAGHFPRIHPIRLPGDGNPVALVNAKYAFNACMSAARLPQAA